MSVELIVKDIRATILDYDLYGRQRAPLLRDFFRFRGRPRNFSNAGALGACFFYDLHITHYVEGWGSGAAPPHPGFFEDFFPMILGRLIGPHGRVFLHIESSDPEYFDPRTVATGILVPRGLPYVFLGGSPASSDRGVGADAGSLVFEWPADALDYIVEQWFMSPQVTVEGYASRESALRNVAALYEREDTEETIRQLLEKIDFGFRVWPDNNGLFVLTDKLDTAALKARLDIMELNRALQEAQSRYSSES